MKKLKKILMGLGALLVLCSAFLGMLTTGILATGGPVTPPNSSQTSSSSPINGFVPRTEWQIEHMSLNFGSDRSTIIATFPEDTIAGERAAGGTVTFQDSDTTDTIYNYMPQTDFCNTGSSGGIWFSASPSDKYAKYGATTISIGKTVPSTIKAYVDLDYLPLAATGLKSDLSSCSNLSSSGKPSTVGNNTKLSNGNLLVGATGAGVLNDVFQWQNSADGKTSTLSEIGPLGEGSQLYSTSETWSPTGLDRYFVNSNTTNATCSDIAVVSTDNKTVNVYRLDSLSTAASNINASQVPELSAYFASLGSSSQGGGFCHVLWVNNKAAPNTGDVSLASLTPYAIAGARSSLPSAGGTGLANSSSTTQSCVGVDVGDGDLDWIICPIVKGVGEAGNLMNGFIQGQLNYDVNANLGGVTCPVGSDKCSVHKAWTIFKDLISAVLVIILLVMVISQAIGGGPFEAYTIRKILPKLVIAVIGMQISWSIGIYLIQLANDAGQGIGQLIAAPFGGLAALDLPALMARLHPAWSATFGGWVGVLVVGIGVYLFWPMMLLGAFTLLVAVAAAMATLLIRNALIVLAIISAPLAILAWVMPGTQKFWKYWSSNFSKALMLFPLVMGLIYGGRIFGWVAGNLGNPGPFDFLMVFAGFVGPYIFLPKTFKWGGSILAQANNGIIKARDWASKRPNEFFKNRQKGWDEERTRRSQERYQRGEPFNWSRPWRRPIDLLKSGERDPTLRGRRRESAMSKYRAAGLASEEEEQKTADQDFASAASIARNHDELTRSVLEAPVGGNAAYTDRYGRARQLRVTRTMKRAGMNAGVKYGTDATFRLLSRTLDDLNHSPEIEDQIMAQRFLDASVGALKPKMDFLYRGPGDTTSFIPEWDAATGELSGPIKSRIDALNPEAFASMEAPELESLLGGLSQVANHHADANARAVARRHLQTVYDNYEAALNNDQIRRAMGQSLNQTMKAHLDGTGLAERNASRATAGITVPIEQVAGMANAASIAARISAAGVASGSQVQLAPTPTEIRIQHETAGARLLPPPATLAVAHSPGREALKLQIESNPEVLRTLINNIIYTNTVTTTAPPEYIEVLEEKRADAEAIITNPASTPEQKASARDGWNRIVAEIQQTYQRRLDEEVASQVGSGVDPATARASAMSVVDPVTGLTFAEEIQELLPTGASPLKQL